jgi:hypothetical protein
MQLFHSPTSPYVRKVQVTAIEKGLGEGLTLVPCNLVCRVRAAALSAGYDPEVAQGAASGPTPCPPGPEPSSAPGSEIELAPALIVRARAIGAAAQVGQDIAQPVEGDDGVHPQDLLPRLVEEDQ